MINFILFGSFFVMLFLNIPICVSLGMSSILAMMYSGDKLSIVPTNVYNGMAKFLLLAIPFFVLSGNIMAKAGISTRLVQFIDDCIGHRRGGIAIVCVVVACFFGAISGSGPATVAALGIILIPAMINRGGFSAPFSSAMMASASSIAIVIPPSIAFVVYASITGVSVGDMFMGGIIPGIMMGLALVVVIMIEVRKKGLTASREKASWGARWKSFRTAFWGFLMPVIILGGIYGGIFTAPEAAVIATVYSLIVGMFIYRELTLKMIWDMFFDCTASMGGMNYTMAVAGALSAVFVYHGFGEMVQNFFFSISTNPVVIMSLIFVLLFLAGMFVQTTPIMVILSPVLLQIVTPLGISPIQFGLVMLLSLCIAFVTPPVASNLFVAQSMTGLDVVGISKKALPFMAVLIVSMIIVAFVPAVSIGILSLFS